MAQPFQTSSRMKPSKVKRFSINTFTKPTMGQMANIIQSPRVWNRNHRQNGLESNFHLLFQRIAGIKSRLKLSIEKRNRKSVINYTLIISLQTQSCIVGNVGVGSGKELKRGPGENINSNIAVTGNEPQQRS